MPKRRITVAELLEYEERLVGLIERTSELTTLAKERLDAVPAIEEHISRTVAIVEENRSEVNSKIEQHLAEAQSQIIQHLTDAQSHASAAQLQAGRAHSNEQEIRNIRATCETSKRNIARMVSDSQQHHNEIAEFHDEIATQRNTLASLIESAEGLGKQLEYLLPGATSAGLASAFRKRRLVFTRPKLVWVFTLAASLLGLFFVAYLDPARAQLGEPTIANASAYLLGRLPFALPLVWLALYAGRRHSQALRLEEEYAHKEVLSRSFEGYKKQIAELEGSESGNKHTLELIGHTLRAMALHPGRIYHGRRDEGHPIWSLVRRPRQSRDSD